jgi:hypothetical protein
LQDDIEEGTVNVQTADVVYEAELPELVQVETDFGSRDSDHIGQRPLADLWSQKLRFVAFFPEAGRQKEHAGQPLLARIKELIHQVLFNAKVAGKQIGDGRSVIQANRQI